MAPHRIEWKSSALRELRRLDRPVISRIVATVESLADNSFPRGARKLSGAEHTYRVRVGDYRIIYEVFENASLIEIVRVRHRRDVYRT